MVFDDTRTLYESESLELRFENCKVRMEVFNVLRGLTWPKSD